IYSVWLTAILFSAIHFQFEGFLPRFLLGLYLGYLFYWTKNLIVPIVAHFCNNALMLVAGYLNPEMISKMEETPMPDLPWYSLLISIILLIPLIAIFRRDHVTDATQMNPEHL
ncbi:MAG: CPBP family intramembrane metalloprotease, partial [Saprospiraceae bacterium]|nr:CPBP family intramembrane metalloprotease [Saprospiraceae bacterium]